MITNLASGTTNATECNEASPDEGLLVGTDRLKCRTPVCASHTINLDSFKTEFLPCEHLDET